MSPPRNLRVCFVARDDFVDKPGGDTTQWRVYTAAAESAGLECLDWFDDSAMPEADLFHALNVDRPLEIYPKMRKVTARGRPFILSTIHHPSAWLERFRSVEPPGGIAGRLLYGYPAGRRVSVSEPMKELVRVLKQGRLARLRHLWPSWSARARWLLENATRVMLLAPDEAIHLRGDFRLPLPSCRTVVVPNWVEGMESQGVSKAALLEGWSEPPVLVVGRIEARKNVLRLARLAQRVRRPTLFVGRPNPNEGRYVASFKAELKTGPFARWIPGVARPELAAFYRVGSFLMNASYVEVSPFVDLEALSFGCPIATTRYALHHGLLPPGTPQSDAYDEESLAKLLQWRPGRLAPKEMQDPAACRKALVDTYMDAVAGDLPV